MATTEGIKGEDVQDLMIAAVEARFGQVNRLPHTIEWLSDNGSGYIASDTRALAREIGLEPRTGDVNLTACGRAGRCSAMFQAALPAARRHSPNASRR